MKITKPEQIQDIILDENKVFYIYGKIGSGKTYFVKEMAKKNNKKVFYTDFYEIINTYIEGKELQIEDEEVIIIDDEIKTILKKEMVCLTLKRMLEEFKNQGKILVIISNLTPEELKQKNESLADTILSGEQIEIMYDIESRIKIAQEYSKTHKIVTNNNILESIAKEENLGKIRGSINQMSIV